MTQPHGWAADDLPMRDDPFETVLWLEALDTPPGQRYKFSRARAVTLEAFARTYPARVRA